MHPTGGSTDPLEAPCVGRLRTWARMLVAASVFEPALAAATLAVVLTCTRVGALQRSPLVQPRLEEPSSNVAAQARPAKSDVRDAGMARDVPVVPSQDSARGANVESTTFDSWRRALEQLIEGKRTQPLRVLWFGDSHTAADYFPNAVRKQFARQVPLGGPGYVSLGVPGYRHGLAKVWSEGATELFPHPPARRSREGDGVFGLGGTRVALRDSTALLTAKPAIGSAAVPMNFELSYRLAAESDVLRLVVGSQHFEIKSGSGEPGAGGLRQHRFVASSDTPLEIRAQQGRPELFGLVMETQQPGFVIDTLGVNGARFGTLLAWHEDALAAVVERRQPSLFIVAFGTNEVFDPEPVERHARKLDEVILRLRQGAADASCLVIGPTDVGKGGEATRSRVVALDIAERATAERLACGYFSPFELMSSEGGFESWARHEPPLALSDGIHLSVRGYTRLGDAVAQLLLPTR